MPKLSMNCVFRTQHNRLFKVVGMGGAGDSAKLISSWQIVEVQRVKHDNKDFLEAISMSFFRDMGELQEKLALGVILLGNDIQL